MLTSGKWTLKSEKWKTVLQSLRGIWTRLKAAIESPRVPTLQSSSPNVAKGRPPIIPRIEALERRVTDLENAVLELAATQVKRIAEPKLKDYEPQFTTWPKANGS